MKYVETRNCQCYNWFQFKFIQISESYYKGNVLPAVIYMLHFVQVEIEPHSSDDEQEVEPEQEEEEPEQEMEAESAEESEDEKTTPKSSMPLTIFR